MTRREDEKAKDWFVRVVSERNEAAAQDKEALTAEVDEARAAVVREGPGSELAATADTYAAEVGGDLG